MFHAAFLLLVAALLGACSFFGVDGTPPGMGYVAAGALASSLLTFAVTRIARVY